MSETITAAEAFMQEILETQDISSLINCESLNPKCSTRARQPTLPCMNSAVDSRTLCMLLNTRVTT